MGFMHPYTCPDIDKAIAEFHDNLECEVNSFLLTLFPEVADKLYEKDIEEEVKQFVKDIYESGCIEQAFEDVRSSNEDIRSSAETQINDLEYELRSKEEEVDDCNNIIANLENELLEESLKVQELKSRVEYLESLIN